MLNFLNYVETGESQLINSNIVNPDDIYKYICLNYGVTTKQISEKFSISAEDTKESLMELYKVNGLIKVAYVTCNPEDDNCSWTKYY